MNLLKRRKNDKQYFAVNKVGSKQQQVIMDSHFAMSISTELLPESRLVKSKMYNSVPSMVRYFHKLYSNGNLG